MEKDKIMRRKFGFDFDFCYNYERVTFHPSPLSKIVWKPIQSL